MYAIIQTGGKQYRVEKGDTIEVELLGIEKWRLLNSTKSYYLVMDQTTHIGAPHIPKCLVKGEVIGDKKGPKVVSFKYKRRKNYHRKVGHRQKYTVVKITAIERS